MSEQPEETRSPAAKMLLAMMRATMNIEQSELEQSGIIDEPVGNSPAWDKWNKDAPMFIVKLDDRKLNALAALIKHKFPAAFGSSKP